MLRLWRLQGISRLSLQRGASIHPNGLRLLSRYFNRVRWCLTVTGHGDTLCSMVGKTAAERKAAERARKRETGLVRWEFWLTRTEALKVAKYIKRMRGHGYGLKSALNQ